MILYDKRICQRKTINEMKTIRIIGLLLVTVTVIASSQINAQQPTAEELLADPQKREEIMKTICKDHEMMNEMMGMMKLDTVTTKIMMEDMMQMIESDFAMCKMMGDVMMNNQHMMNMMHEMNGEKGGMRGGRMMRGMMMMCPMHGGMRMSDDIEGEKEHGNQHNH